MCKEEPKESYKRIWGKCSAACLQYHGFGGSVIFWGGMFSQGRTDLHIPVRCTLIVVMWGEIFRPTGTPYVGDVGTGFLWFKTTRGLMHLKCVIRSWMTKALILLTSPGPNAGLGGDPPSEYLLSHQEHAQTLRVHTGTWRSSTHYHGPLSPWV